MKISKNFKLYSVIWIILVVVFNVLVFATPDTYNKFSDGFWIGYTLVMIAAVGQLVCAYIGLGSDNLNKVFYNLPLVKISFVGIVVSVVAGSIFMIIPTDIPWFAGIVSFIILAFIAIAMIKAKATGDIVSDIDDKIKAQTFFIKAITVDTESLMAFACTPEAKALVEKIHSELRYSDPMSHEGLREIESQIDYEFRSFEFAVKSNNVNLMNSKSKELLYLINNRNSKCKLLK